MPNLDNCEMNTITELFESCEVDAGCNYQHSPVSFKTNSICIKLSEAISITVFHNLQTRFEFLLQWNYYRK